MKQRLQLFVMYLLYTSILALASGAYAGHWVMLILIYVGGFFGMALPKLVCVFAQNLAKEKVTLNRYFFQSVWTMLRQENSHEAPTSRIGKLLYSYPFLFAFGMVALYVATSSSGWFGKALVLGMGLRLVIDIVESSADISVLKARWFSEFPTRLTDLELRILVSVCVIFQIVLTILAIKL